MTSKTTRSADGGYCLTVFQGSHRVASFWFPDWWAVARAEQLLGGPEEAEFKIRVVAEFAWMLMEYA